MQVTDGGVVPRYRFAGGHSAVVRSFWWHAATGAVVTGGEDSRICVWGAAAPALAPTMPSPQRDGKVRRTLLGGAWRVARGSRGASDRQIWHRGFHIGTRLTVLAGGAKGKGR